MPVGDGSSFAAVDNRRTKIVATLGPASSNEVTFRELVRAGLDVARLNFSHGSHPQKLKLIKMVRKVAQEEASRSASLAICKGRRSAPAGSRTASRCSSRPDSKLTITPRDIAGTATLLSTTFPTLAENLEPGARILLSDGLIELYVTAVHGQRYGVEVINGGMLGEHKGINLPGIPVRVPSLTAKDEDRSGVRDSTAAWTPSPYPSCAPRKISARCGDRVACHGRRDLDHCQARKAAGHSAPGKHSRNRRRSDGRPRRSGR